MEALSESCSTRRPLRELWHHRPRGRSCSVYAGASGRCRLGQSAIKEPDGGGLQLCLRLRLDGLTPPAMVLAAILGLEPACRETWLTVAVPDSVNKYPSLARTSVSRMVRAGHGRSRHGRIHGLLNLSGTALVGSVAHLAHGWHRAGQEKAETQTQIVTQQALEAFAQRIVLTCRRDTG